MFWEQQVQQQQQLQRNTAVSRRYVGAIRVQYVGVRKHVKFRLRVLAQHRYTD